jgi:steroid 5-alpha reductase family enzyme
VIWCFSFYFGNSSLYDPAWVFLPIGIALGWMGCFTSISEDDQLTDNPPSERGVFAMALLILWCLRYNISWPWNGWTKGINTEDWRYVEMSKFTGERTVEYWIGVSLIGSHIVPTLLVFFALAPM